MAVWCQDEAGPYQAIPQPVRPGSPWGSPPAGPHEYIRGGTAKLLTLFRPATGEVRAEPVATAPNAVLHPWLKAELVAILAALPAADAAAPRPRGLAGRPGRQACASASPCLADLPPLRALLIWDNLTRPQEPRTWCSGCAPTG